MSKVKANGILMVYEDTGREWNFLLIHGMGDNNKMWWNQMVPAINKYFRVIAYDVRGHGLTERPKDGYSVDNLAKDIQQFWPMCQSMIGQELENPDEVVFMGSRPIIMGYSMGGRIALEYAVRNPKDVRALILVSSGVGLPRPTPSPEMQKRREEMMALLKKGDTKKWAEMMTTSAFSPGFRQKDAKSFDRYMKVKQEQKADALLRVMEGMAAPAPAPDLSKLTMPVLIVVGQNDPNMGPEQGKQAQQAVPGSRLVVLPTGHASPIEAPDQFNAAVLEFLLDVRANTPPGKI